MGHTWLALSAYSWLCVYESLLEGSGDQTVPGIELHYAKYKASSPPAVYSSSTKTCYLKKIKSVFKFLFFSSLCCYDVWAHSLVMVLLHIARELSKSPTINCNSCALSVSFVTLGVIVLTHLLSRSQSSLPHYAHARLHTL